MRHIILTGRIQRMIALPGLWFDLVSDTGTETRCQALPAIAATLHAAVEEAQPLRLWGKRCPVSGIAYVHAVGHQ